MMLLSKLDILLNRITGYRLAVYYLAGLVLLAVAFSAFGFLPYAPLAVVADAVLALVTCVALHIIIARILKSGANVESSIITALILVLIIPVDFPQNVPFLLLASTIAVASKYLLTVEKQHIFNPAAVAVAALSLVWPDYTATWWVGTGIMLPFVAVGGWLLVRKLRLGYLVIAFIATFLSIVTLAADFGQGGPAKIPTALSFSLFQSAVLFFACVMLTEPFTLPATRRLRLYYGALVGLLYATPQFRPFGLALTPEFALCLGNVFSYAFNPKYRLVLKLRRRRTVGPQTVAFEFEHARNFSFIPGQYMEWTLPNVRQDSRGNRRYFTIASSPKEPNVTVLVKFPDHMSNYKSTMLRMKKGDTVIASRLAGDFVLPRDLSTPMVFLAGGVGVAPFRSMVQHIVDEGWKCDIVLFYMERSPEDFLNDDLFERAKGNGVRTVRVLTDASAIPNGWTGRTGRVTAEMIAAEVPNASQRLYYISGPNAMVNSYVSLLRDLAIPKKDIVTDYFPGYQEQARVTG